MMKPVPPEITRRQILTAGALGLGALLTGCSSRPRRRPPLSNESIWSDADLAQGARPLDAPIATTEPLSPAIEAAVPRVIPRQSWTREAPRTWLANPMGRITRITVHHDGMPPVSIRNAQEAAARIDLIRRAHVGKGWADIGYHYIVDPQGRVWQGRPRNLQGAHVKDYNERNLGIVVLGNFMEQRPTPAATSSLDRFVLASMRAFRVPLHEIHTHRELRPTACPGDTLQSHMNTARARGGSVAANI
jgi:hypothetical protein